MWMPNMPMTLISAYSAKGDMPSKATFKVLPSMTKHEVREYLTKIYNLPVKKVNTQNFLGKRKRIAYKKKLAYYKYADYKKAIVTFDHTLKDVGIGTQPFFNAEDYTNLTPEEEEKLE